MNHGDEQESSNIDPEYKPSDTLSGESSCSENECVPEEILPETPPEKTNVCFVQLSIRDNTPTDIPINSKKKNLCLFLGTQCQTTQTLIPRNMEAEYRKAEKGQGTGLQVKKW